MSFLDFFTDPVLRGPTWGTLLMCISSSLMGVVLFFKKRILLGESLSHATYPGVVAGVSFFAFFFPAHEEWTFVAVLGGAFISSLLGLKAIEWMEQKGKVRSDAALCFVLAVFFGIGTVGASAMQLAIPVWYQQVQILLFGQAATMSDSHIILYAVLSSAVVLFITCSFRPLQALLFDRDFAKSAGIPVLFLEKMVFWLLLFSIVLGIRSVGVVLMSGMVIAPVIAARQFTHQLRMVFFLSACFGALSGLLGNILSVIGSSYFSFQETLTLPTGPMIILVSASFALFSLLFAPHRGWIFRLSRMVFFRLRCLQENILKALWRNGSLSFLDLRKAHAISSFSFRLALFGLSQEGWIEKKGGLFSLTKDGIQKAESVVRLHRLWELYLARALGFEGDRIHRNAEEMEHILTPELERQLTVLLANPTADPHNQPIPQKERGL